MPSNEIIQFPQELIEEIIDHLADGHSRHLRLCSLVCHAWLSRSRSHLFASCSPHTANILGFRSLLQSPCCTFLPHVRRIYTLRYSWDPNDGCFDELMEYLRLLTGVSTLEMEGTNVVSAATVNAFFSYGICYGFPARHTPRPQIQIYGGGNPRL
ncbi:hypothetical protein B0H19DRAFT_1104805 [Mycena capillaripes]|nr:hypothetical protein B0H19DRAFT_1104805 [Mycena capillaripes]